MRLTRSLLAAALAASLTLVLAQPPFQAPGFGYSTTTPAGWAVESTPPGDDLLMGATSPDGTSAYTVYAAVMTPDILAELQGYTRDEIVQELFQSFGESVPGAALVGATDGFLAGAPALYIDYTGDQSARGQLILVNTDRFSYTIAWVVTGQNTQQMVAAAQAALATFTLGADAGTPMPIANQTATPAVAPAPLAAPLLPGTAAPGTAAPGTAAPGTNPLSRPVALFTGSYAGDGLGLDLRSSPNGYEGQLTYGGASYPVAATETPNGLVGQFFANGVGYSFTAVLTPSGLTFVNEDGTTFALQRRN